MLNKKYIIGGVIILVIIAGAVFFSRNNSSTPDASVLEKGVKNLTRESAAKMIKTYLELNPSSGKMRQFSYDKQLEHFSLRYVADTSLDVQMLRKLEQAGFVKIVEEKKSPYGGVNNLEYLTFDFTDQAKPYLVKLTYPADTKNVNVLLAKVVEVEVTGITEADVKMANYTAKYELTPIGKIIDEKSAGEEAKRQIPFQLYDDGWRIAL